MKLRSIPQTDSIEELARFWDEHDVTDYDDELVIVEESVFQNRDDAIVQVHLPRQEMARLQRLADEKGVDFSALVQEWVLEKLQAA